MDAMKHTQPTGSPWRRGYHDGCKGLPCESPWTGWRNMAKAARYYAGHLDGQQAMRKLEAKDIARNN